MASWTWLKTLLGIRVDEAELHLISEPVTELGLHITLRYIQAGSVLGVGIVGPIMALGQSGLNILTVVRMAGKCGKAGAMFGFVLGPLATLINVRYLNIEQVTEVCYQLRCEEQRRTVDRYSVCGLGVGSLMGKVLKKNAGHFGAIGVVGGLIVGELMALSSKDQDLMEIQ